MNFDIQNDASIEIAKRSRGTPRIALRLLKRVRDFSDVAGEKEISLKTTKYALEQLGVNENGFDVATKILPTNNFYKADDGHQNYYDKKGSRPYCHGYKKRF